MKKIINCKDFLIPVTKCFDDETGKYYKLEERQTHKLFNAVLTKFYSPKYYRITNIEVE